MKINIKITNILSILIGAAIFSFGIVHFNMQNQLAEGGFTGITLLLYFMFQFNPAITNLVLNIPLFFVGYKLFSRTTFIYTVIGTVSVSLFLAIFQKYQLQIPLHDDLLLAALFAGVFIGIGLGIIFKNGGTTGGVDIIARIVKKYIGWNMGKTMFIFDFFVITTSLVYLNYRQAMYTLVAVFVGAKVIDFIQEGAYAAKAVIIISERADDIATTIMEKMERGITIVDGKGAYTKETKEILYCVVSRHELFRLKSYVRAIDPHAFITIANVHEVLGEGFTLDENKKPLYDE
ncbi:YitT family protein [Massilibacterium senegalense]|uniref:YitT family protein n=1 Tax=Massilibacterium senegalense TaxID=1632858 RepID=UPI0007864409|nr:YitT family protein [Massilibacterium senegalense]